MMPFKTVKRRTVLSSRETTTLTLLLYKLCFQRHEHHRSKTDPDDVCETCRVCEHFRRDYVDVIEMLQYLPSV